MPSFSLPSIFLAGFECSAHRRWDRQRLDLIEATRHDLLCDRDYALITEHGISGARDGFRWHLIERERGNYDWSSVRPMLQSARRRGVRVIWDLCHYGYPDWLDLWSPEAPGHFARFCHEAVRLIRQESGQAPAICPVNEMSFWAWLGGTEGRMNPYAVGRGGELKRQLVRMSLAGVQAAKAADPSTTVFCAEPLIKIIPDSNDEADIRAADAYHESQFEAVDLLLGRREPELGGHAGAVDVIGVNFYPHNQWRLRGGFVPLGHYDYVPLSELLGAVARRYGKPLVIAETGAEHSARASWLSYVGAEVRTAMAAGVPVLGICLYPITDYRGWDNDRICQVGLFCNGDGNGGRTVYMPLLQELYRQQALFAEAGVGGAAVHRAPPGAGQSALFG